MSQAEFAVNFFVALFALLDPSATCRCSPPRRRACGRRNGRRSPSISASFVIGFLTFFYFTGLGLLEFFGISLPAFRIAGGIILLLLGLTMARDDFTASFADAAEDAPDPSPEERRGYARRRFEKMIVPFGMPLLIGPGAISTVIIYASQRANSASAGRRSASASSSPRPSPFSWPSWPRR
jgi:multiple antibiotic resistance protein